MHGDTIFKVLSLAVLWVGVALFVNGIQVIYDSGYRPPKTPPGWSMGMAWIVAGGAMATGWVSFITGHLIDQKCNGKPRWSVTSILSSSLILLGAAALAVVGTFLTWRHPYRLGPCECLPTEWGPNCEPCQCGEHGICDGGTYGSGRCSCDFGFAGDRCDRCAERFKPEGACDTCKTGFAGDKCDRCARQYTGPECSQCANGWRPWYNSSALFPNTTDEDGRHICDECAANHFGYDCRPCPWGNDVPRRMLDRNNPIVKGTRVITTEGITGAIESMQVEQDSAWTDSFAYNIQHPSVLSQTRVRIRKDYSKTLSSFLLLDEIRGVECNNRGFCEDDDRHQALNPNWQDTCTYTTAESCTTDEDCTVSENCKGTCQGTELPVSALWEAQLGGTLCKTDADCLDKSIYIDQFNNTYTGGRCVSRVCCDESRHGKGNCQCERKFFGIQDPDSSLTPLSELSPACDFCPGYDWFTEEPSSICSGGKGTCSASYSRNGDYLQMRCSCGSEVYIDPVTGIPDPSRIIGWSGNLCQCGDWNNDQECDICASSYWGPDCTQCPGGYGSRACSGHGTCRGSGTNSGDGQCICDIDNPKNTAWMLAPFIKRYASETVGRNAAGQDWTCSECAPNHYGPDCQVCTPTDTATIQPSQIDDIFQPPDSYAFLNQSSIHPVKLCHPQRPTMCWLACGGGGWCNWGREGTGECTCWSNRRQNALTWNPLDNVCIGNVRYDGAMGDYQGYGEVCPAYGRCSGGDSSRNTADMCGCQDPDNCTASFIGDDKDMSKTIQETGWQPIDDWVAPPNNNCPPGQQCYAWNQIDWTFESRGTRTASCTMDA